LPLIVHNLVRPMDSLHAATVDDQPVARAISVPGLVSGAAGLARQVARVSGVGAGPSDAGPGPSVRHPTDDLWRKIDHAVGAARPLGTLVYAVLLLGALGLSLVRGPRLVGAMAASGALLLVLVNTSWDNFYDSRYVAFLAVLGWVALGVQSAPILGNDARRRGRSLRAATAVSLLALVAYPLFVTAAWYRAERAAGRTNSALVAEADRLSAAARQSGSPIMVDERLRSIELGGGGNGERALVYLTRLRGAHALVADETELRWFLDQPEARVIFVAGPETVARVDAPWQAGTSNEWSVAVIGAPDGALGSPAP
jgi:hypothetical protein